MNIECEFCQEINDYSNSRIGHIYKNILSSRVISSSENFIAVPTIGQIMIGSLLVLPKKHFQTIGELFKSNQDELLTFVESLTKKIGKSFFLYEHGAKSHTGSSCGVYHAHLHMVPYSAEFNHHELCGSNCIETKSIENAYKEVEFCDNYLLLKTVKGKVYFNTFNTTDKSVFESQHMRKWLANEIKSDRDWNWRNYDEVENDIIELIR